MSTKFSHIKPHFKHITFSISQSTSEKVQALIFRSWEKPNSVEEIHFACDSLGYLFLELLNLDLQTLISKMSAHDTSYQNMINQHDVLRLFLWDELSTLFETSSSFVHETSYTLQRVKDYVKFCEDHSLAYHTRFFDYLNETEYFGSSATIPELGSIKISPLEINSESLSELSNSKLDDLYSLFCTYGNNIESTEYHINPGSRIGSILLATLCELDKAGKVVRQCQNCKRYFIPHNRSDTLYCDHPSPQNAAMTCKEYGTQRLWYDRLKENELATLSRKIASAKGMLAKRNPDIPQYAKSYEYFKAQRLIWMKAVKEGAKTQEEYREWLLSMQRQKIIKEAAHGND